MPLLTAVIAGLAGLALVRVLAGALGPRTGAPPAGRVPWPVWLAFLLSGAAALVYQVVWQRLLALHGGVGIYSIALIVAAFMAGLGLGSYVGGRLSAGFGAQRALWAFGLLEAALALLGGASSWLYYDLLQQLPPLRSAWLAGSLHFAVLLPPTTLMGMSLPFLARAVVLEPSGAGRRLGTLYAVNLLGASLGAALAPWVLMRLYGLRGATLVAAAGNLVAALLVLAWRPRDEARDDAPQPAPVAVRLGSWVPLYALSGFCALALEIVWFRLFDVAARATAFSFGTVLALYLGGCALGSLAGAALAPRLRAPLPAFLAVQGLILLYAGLGPLLLAHLPAGLPGAAWLLDYWRSGAVFRLGPEAAARPLLVLYGLLPLALYGPPTFLMGLSFPILQRAVQDEVRTAGLKTGLLQAANIAGCVAGSLLAGLVGLQRLGTAGTLRALLLAGALFPLLGLRHARLPFALAAAALVALALGQPDGERLWTRLHGIPADKPALVEEDASGVALLHGPAPGRWVLWTNGHQHSALPYGRIHTLLGALPVVVHPAPRAVAIVGLGSGDTAWAAGLRPETERVEVFEICAAQRRLLGRLAQREPLPQLLRLLGDPRLRLHDADGRLALAQNPGRFDVVEMDALWPYYAYSGNLYSREFYRLAARSLRPGGIMCTWAPTPRVRATFASVFPHVLVAARGRVLLGGLQPFEAREAARAEALLQARRYLGPGEAGYVTGHFRQLAPLGDAPGLPPNEDLVPRDELSLSLAGES